MLQSPADGDTQFDLPPEEVRRLGRLAADAVAEHRERLEQRPVFGKVGGAAPLFQGPPPEDGRPFDEVLAFVREHVLPRPMGNSHPRFFGFINATADPVGTVADYLASAMNPNCWGGDHASVHVEDRVLRWLAESLGLPAAAEGILASGGSMANFIALAAARRAMTPGNVREDGLGGEGRPRLAVYASDQVHSLRRQGGGPARPGHAPPAQDPDRRPLPHAAWRRCARRWPPTGSAGLQPAIVVGNAGTVNTGAIDPLDELADFCAREGLWFHVDGAYGALAVLSPQLRPLFAGMERARLPGLRPAQVALRALRGRRRVRARAGPAGRRLPQVPRVPGL